METFVLGIPRAAELRPARRPGYRGGRPYIGPRIQIIVSEEDYDALLDYMEREGLTEKQYPEVMRAVFAAGVRELRTGAA